MEVKNEGLSIFFIPFLFLSFFSLPFFHVFSCVSFFLLPVFVCLQSVEKNAESLSSNHRIIVRWPKHFHYLIFLPSYPGNDDSSLPHSLFLSLSLPFSLSFSLFLPFSSFSPFLHHFFLPQDCGHQLTDRFIGLVNQEWWLFFPWNCVIDSLTNSFSLLSLLLFLFMFSLHNFNRPFFLSVYHNWVSHKTVMSSCTETKEKNCY